MAAIGEPRGDRDGREVGLSTEVSGQAGWRVVAFQGDLDLAEAEVAAGALGSAIAGASRGIVVDLTQISFLGSTGVRVLLEARARAAEAGLGFRVVQGQGPARRLIGMLGLEQGLDLVDSD